MMFLHRRLDKKTPKEKVVIAIVVETNMSSDDEYIGCDPLKKHQIEATIEGKVLKNAFNNMVDNNDIEVPYLFPSIERGIMVTRGRIVHPP